MNLSWCELETKVGLDALPEFHRAFLAWRGIEGVQEMPLRRVGQRVSAELNGLVQAGLPQKKEDDWLISSHVLASFAAVLVYL